MTRPVLDGVDASLLDIVDHVLTKGIVLTGDLVLGVADVDLIYLRLSALLCAFDRIAGPSATPVRDRRRQLDVTNNRARPRRTGAARAHRRRAP
jgi:hypothetical protein